MPGFRHSHGQVQIERRVNDVASCYTSPEARMPQHVLFQSLLGICLLLFGSGVNRGEEKTISETKNVLIIGRSSLTGLPIQVRDLLESHKRPMNVDEGPFGARSLERMLSGREVWDYVIMDAWQFQRGSTAAPEFPDAVTAFVKEVRAHSPRCQIILFPWWLPERKATNEDVMEVFRRCVEVARPHGIWVATTGPAFMEARLARPDLRVTVSQQDAHPGIHGSYINACSLVAILTGESPVGLPATLRIRGRQEDIAPEDAKYLQELAWKVYQRELKDTKPAKGARDK
jgi:hypothetical protein